MRWGQRRTEIKSRSASLLRTRFSAVQRELQRGVVMQAVAVPGVTGLVIVSIHEFRRRTIRRARNRVRRDTR